MLERHLEKGTVIAMDFLQVIARCASADNQASYAKCWYPSVEPSMNFMPLASKARLVMYVLHAKHMRDEKKVDNLRDRIEEFDEVLAEA